MASTPAYHKTDVRTAAHNANKRKHWEHETAKTPRKKEKRKTIWLLKKRKKKSKQTFPPNHRQRLPHHFSSTVISSRSRIISSLRITIISLSSSSCFPPFLSPFSSLVFVLVVYWYHVLILMLPSLSLSSSSVFLPGSESSSPGSESDCFCLVSWVVVLSCCRWVPGGYLPSSSVCHHFRFSTFLIIVDVLSLLSVLLVFSFCLSSLLLPGSSLFFCCSGSACRQFVLILLSLFALLVLCVITSVLSVILLLSVCSASACHHFFVFSSVLRWVLCLLLLFVRSAAGDCSVCHQFLFFIVLSSMWVSWSSLLLSFLFCSSCVLSSCSYCYSVLLACVTFFAFVLLFYWVLMIVLLLRYVHCCLVLCTLLPVSIYCIVSMLFLLFFWVWGRGVFLADSTHENTPFLPDTMISVCETDNLYLSCVSARLLSSSGEDWLIIPWMFT